MSAGCDGQGLTSSQMAALVVGGAVVKGGCPATGPRDDAGLGGEMEDGAQAAAVAAESVQVAGAASGVLGAGPGSAA